MVDEKQAYFELIKEYCNNPKIGKHLEAAPTPIQLAVDKLIKYSSKDANVQSEGIADLKQSYFEVKDFPSDVKALIKPYVVRKVKFI